MRPQKPSLDLLVFSPRDLQQVLGVGRSQAYAIAKLIGRRSGRRLLVAKSRLEQWLSDNSAPKSPVLP